VFDISSLSRINLKTTDFAQKKLPSQFVGWRNIQLVRKYFQNDLNSSPNQLKYRREREENQSIASHEALMLSRTNKNLRVILKS